MLGDALPRGRVGVLPLPTGFLESYALHNLAIPLLCCLSRRAENLADRGPGSPRRPSPHHSVDDLAFASGTVQRGALEDVLLNRTFIVVVRLIRLQTFGEIIGMIETILE